MSARHEPRLAGFLLLVVAAFSGGISSAWATPTPALPAQHAPPGADIRNPQPGAASIPLHAESPSPTIPLAGDLSSESPAFRCALAKTLARQLVNMLEWADLERYVDPSGESNMVIVSNNLRLIKRTEICSIDVWLLKHPGSLRVVIAGADYPSRTPLRTAPPLPLLFLEDVTPVADTESSHAWRFEWRRNMVYHNTCSIKDAKGRPGKSDKPDKPEKPEKPERPEKSVRSRVPIVCQGPMTAQVPAPVVVIEVTPTHDRAHFDVLRASFEFVRFPL